MDVLHRYQKIMNPITDQKLDKLVKLLRLAPGSSVLDIACGKGELLFRLSESYRIHGVGIDKSPYCIDACNAEKLKRAPEADISFHLMDGANYTPDRAFDLTSCLGGSWVFSDHTGTLKALSGMTRSGGTVLVGEPYLLKEPDPELLKADGISRDSLRSHRENVEIGVNLGLHCLYFLDSDLEGWDHYESLHWWAAEDYIRDNPDDPDVPEIRAVNERIRETYLCWGRDTYGWAIYVFRKP